VPETGISNGVNKGFQADFGDFFVVADQGRYTCRSIMTGQNEGMNEAVRIWFSQFCTPNAKRAPTPKGEG
jgi:hypothetical protein